MALRAEYTLHHSDLRNFLSETIWEEQNGSVLSVISAFARLDMDPWQEAARLAAMPREAAVAALADVLGLLPTADPEHTDHIALARQLIEVLPDRHALGPAAQQGQRPDTPGRRGVNVTLLLGIAVVLGFLQAIGQLF